MFYSGRDMSETRDREVYQGLYVSVVLLVYI